MYLKKVGALVLLAALLMSLTGGIASASGDDSKPTISVTIYDRGNIPVSEGTIEQNKITEWINENSPVNVEFHAIPRWTEGEAIATMFATGNAPDIIFTYSPETWYQEGLTMPLTTLLEENSTAYLDTLNEYPDSYKIATPAGEDEMHFFVRVWPTTANHILVVRKDWLDALGLDVPTDLEAFKEVLLAFVNDDPDGNGVKDTYGINASFIAGQMLANMFGVAPPYMSPYLEDGELVFDDDRVMASFEFKKWLFDNGIIDKDFLTDTNGEKATADFTSGKMGFLPQGNVALKTIVTELYKNEPDAEVIFVAYPTTEYGSFLGPVQGTIAPVGFINKNAKDPAACIQYIDFLQENAVYERIVFGIEGEHFVYNESGSPISEGAMAEAYAAEMQWASGFDYCMPYALINAPDGWTDPRAKVTEAMKETDRATYDFAYIEYEAAKSIYEEGRQRAGAPYTATVSLPTEIQFIYDSFNSVVSDTWNKAVVSGDSYTVQNAYDEIQKIKQDIGYDQYVAYMQSWFAENADSIYMSDSALELKPGYID